MRKTWECKFQANAAHLWTPVPLCLDLGRWSGKKLGLRCGSQIAQGKSLDPRIFRACSSSRGCPCFKGSKSHCIDIQACWVFWGEVYLLSSFYLPQNYHTNLHMLWNKTQVASNLEGGKGSIPDLFCFVLSYMQWHKVDLRHRVIWITTQGCTFWPSK